MVDPAQCITHAENEYHSSSRCLMHSFINKHRPQKSRKRIPRLTKQIGGSDSVVAKKRGRCRRRDCRVTDAK